MDRPPPTTEPSAAAAAFAERLWRRAIADDPQAAGPHADLGRWLATQGRRDEAAGLLRRACALDPTDAAARLALGMVLAEQGQTDEAEAWLRAAIAAAPDGAAAHARLGVLLAGCERHAEAERCYLQALSIAPDDAATLANLGALLSATGRLANAERCLRWAIEIDPLNAGAYTNLGLALQTLGQPEAAEAALRHACELAPRQPELQANLGRLLVRSRRSAEGIGCLRAAAALAPDVAVHQANLGVALAETGDVADLVDAEAAFRAALRLQPAAAQARVNLGALLLAQGRHAEGWRLHEARHDPAQAQPIARPALSIPPWCGEPVDGRAIVVWPEQGYGDQIMACRYVPMLKRLGATQVTLVCSRPLQRLFRTLDGVDAVQAADVVDNRFVLAPDQPALAAHDAWALSLSLPLHCGTLAGRVAEPLWMGPYLRADRAGASAKLRRFAEMAAADAALVVGLAWRGHARHDNDADRSLPGLPALDALWSLPRVSYVSVQPGTPEPEALAPERPLLIAGDLLGDFADTAVLLSALDLLICVDTAVAHLAGALGVPCWLLLPAHRTDWRWGLEGSGTAWYPQSVRIFRQRFRGDWPGVIDAVRAALAERLAR